MKALLFNLRIFLSLIFLSLFLILADSLGFLNFPKSLIQTLTIPVQFGIYTSGMTVKKQFEFIAISRFAVLENKALKQQMSELLTENSQLKSELQETKSLIDSYNKLSPRTYEMMPARVIGSNRYLKIDKGLNDGISMGQVVVFKDNYIGQVKSVDSKTSQVILITDPDSKIAVFSQGENGRGKGILQGQFGAKLLMDKILHEEKVSEKDLVYSEGTEGRLPKGLIMGKITKVNERQNEVFKQAEVEPIFDLTNLDLVLVIKGS